MPPSVDDFHVLCRLCLGRDGSVPIFPDTESEVADLPERIFNCVSIQVKRESALPKKLCQTCVSQIDSWHSFRTRCHQNQDTLLSLSGESKDDIAEVNVPQSNRYDAEASSKDLESVQDEENSAQECGVAGFTDTSNISLSENQDAVVSSSGLESARPSTDVEGAEAAAGEKPSNSKHQTCKTSISDDAESRSLENTSSSLGKDDSQTPSPKDAVDKSRTFSEADTVQSETQDSDKSSTPPTTTNETIKGDGDEIMDDDFEDDPDLYDEESESVIDEPSAEKLDNSDLQTKDGVKPRKFTLETVDLCEEDDVTVIEPEISQVNLVEEDDALSGEKSLLKTVLESGVKPGNLPGLNGDHQVDKSLSQLSANTASGELTIEIHSAVTLPAPGDFSTETNPSEESGNLSKEKDASNCSEPNLQGNSPAHDDPVSPEDGTASADASKPRATIGNPDEPNTCDPDVMLEVVKEEQDRGYADERKYEDYDVEVPPEIRPPGSKREEVERLMMEKDFSVDAPNMRCIICDHNFYSMLSLYRHTRCRTHLLNRSIIIKQRKGLEVDPKLLAENQRNLNVYKNQWFHGRRRQIGEPVIDRRKNLSCKTCRLVFSSQPDLERHRQSKKHKLYVLMGGPPPQEPIEKRRIIRPQHLQYEHEERTASSPAKTLNPTTAPPSREYCCPIPNCGYVCLDGTILLNHMTSHGYPNQIPPVQKPAARVAPSPPPSRPSPLPQPAAQNNVPAQSEYKQGSGRRQNYENMYCPFHNAHFDTARGYLNHLRGCNLAPPISAFLKPTSNTKRYCKLCDLDFSSHDMFLQHVKVYHKGSSLQQEQESGKPRVGAPAFTPRALHLNKPSSRKHSCHICGKVFALMHSLHIHLKKHQQVSSSSAVRPTCRICKKTFLTRKACASHTKSHFLPPGSNKLFCSNCFKTFNSRPEISRHRFDGTCRPLAGASDSFSCNECDLSFKDKIVLNNHKLRFHPDIKKEIVDEDEEMLNVERLEAQELNEPEPSSSGVDVAPAEYESKELRNCLLCEKSFESQELMRKHCHMIHRMNDLKIDKMIVSFGYTLPPQPPPRAPEPSGSRSAIKECGRCRQSFGNKKQLQDHLIVCPANRRAEGFGNVCQKCQGRGCESCSLPTGDLEVKGESSDLLFKCPIGQMSFNDEKAMLEHYSYCGGTCGPFFECGACGVEFRYRKSFDAHNCNTGRKRPAYECNACKRSFSKRKYLDAHELKCTGQNQATPSSSSSQIVTYNSNSLKKTRRSGPIEGDDGSLHGDPFGNPDVPVQSFPCGKCDKVFHSMKALNGHGWTHNESLPNNQIFCKFCGREELALSSLYQHVYKCVKSLFVTEEVMSCEDCNTFMSRYDTAKELAVKLQAHILSCYPIPWFENEGEAEGAEKHLCFYCCHAFSSIEKLQVHKTTHHRRNPKKRSSPFLYKSPRKRPRFPQQSRVPPEAALYAAHQLEDEDEDINDMIEEEVFESGESCASATASAVATKFILNCSVCNREFHNIDKLRNHEKVHGIVRQVVNEDDPNEADLS